MHNNINKKKGFTLVELFLVLLIGALLMAWGVPNYRDLKNRKLVSDNVNEIVYGLTLARAEAVRYGRVVTVQPISGSWNNGWQVTTTGIEGGADILLYEQQPFGEIDITNGPANLQFNSMGSLVGGAEIELDVEHKYNEDTDKKVIRVGLTGLAKSEDA